MNLLSLRCKKFLSYYLVVELIFLSSLFGEIIVCLIQKLQTSSATVDVIPLFLENARDFEIDSADLIISSPSTHGKQKKQIECTVCIQHVPTGICVQSSGMHIFCLVL